MLIITADDFGKTRHATDSVLRCYARQAITSASAMVFMDDSARAALQAIGTNLEMGLHLNFTLPFTSRDVDPMLREHHDRIIAYLAKGIFTQALYNPFLRDSFAFSVRSQREEFQRLYGRPPDFLNGHHHMHLCANVLSGSALPAGSRIRRTFTFGPGEKGLFNRLYRAVVDRRVERRYISTDCFFSIVPICDIGRLRKIIASAAEINVEIEVHPENPEETEFLLSMEFHDWTCLADKGGFLRLPRKNSRLGTSGV